MKDFFVKVIQLCGRTLNHSKAMKKILLLIISLNAFAQNSVTTDPNGSLALHKIVGVGSTLAYNGAVITHNSQYISTGSTSSTFPMTGVSAIANNSSYQNYGIVGIGSGDGSNFGVSGYALGSGSSTNYGGYFSVNSASTGSFYGVYSNVTSTNDAVESTAYRYGNFSSVITKSSSPNYGYFSSVDNTGTGPAIGGEFSSSNYLNTWGDRIGVLATASGNRNYKYGISTLAFGSGTNIGIISKAQGGTINHAAFLESNSSTSSFQLVLNETESDYARISFQNTNGDGWHQAVYKGLSAASSQFNFYYVPNNTDILSLRGDGNAILAGTLTQSSDFRLKKNIQPINNVSQKINQIRGVYFDWKDDIRSRNTQIGFIAQEIEKVFPELVETDAKGFKSVAYANMSAVLVEALKEQNQRINALERELLEMKSFLKKHNLLIANF